MEIYKILVAEEDPMIALAVQKQLRGLGYQVQSVKDFQQVGREFLDFEPHLVLMSVSLPFCGGCQWCIRIREVSQVPILLADAGTERTHAALVRSAGADDWIAKPFDWNVLVAKVQELLRRSYDPEAQPHMLEHRGVLLDLINPALLYDGKRIELSKNDFRILQTLMEHKGEIVPRELLMRRLWEAEAFVDENTLTVNVTRLRRKLEGAGLRGFIRTKKGVGYVIE